MTSNVTPGGVHRRRSPSSGPNVAQTTTTSGRKRRQASISATNTNRSYKTDQIPLPRRKNARLDSDDREFDINMVATSSPTRFYQMPGKKDQLLATLSSSSSQATPSPHLDIAGAALGNFYSQATQKQIREEDDDGMIDPIDPAEQRTEMNAIYQKSLHSPVDGEEQIPTCQEVAKFYTNILQKHQQDLSREFVRQELTDEKTLGDIDEDTAVGYAWLLRMGMDQEVHDSLLACALPARAKSDEEFSQRLVKLWDHAEVAPDQPRIYGNFLCHRKTGKLMTPRQMQAIIENAQRYVFDDSFAHEIDSCIGEFSQELSNSGVRRYLSIKKDGQWGLPSEVRVERLGILCRALLRRIRQIPGELWDTPMPGTFAEFGYSDQAILRLSQHDNHQSSNYLLNLFEVLMVDYLGEDFQLSQYIICEIPAKCLAEMAEIYVTRCGQGYALNGGGLSHCAAGLSTSSRHNYENKDYERFWQYAKDNYMDANIAAWHAFEDLQIKKMQDDASGADDGNLAHRELIEYRSQLEQKMQEVLKVTPEEETALRRLHEVHRVLKEAMMSEGDEAELRE